MPSLDRYQVPTLLLVLVGLGVVASGFVVFPHPGQREHHHSVERVTASDVPAEATVTGFDDLSPEARQAFRAAVESDDGHHVVYGEANAPPAWRFSDYAGYYYVRYRGSLYGVTTWSGSFEFFDYFGVGLFALCGATAVGVAGLSLRRDRPRAPLTLLVGLATLAVVVTGIPGRTDGLGFPTWLGLALVAGSTVATWLAVDVAWRRD